MGDLLGDPELLRREGEGYIPDDIKSGRGKEGNIASIARVSPSTILEYPGDRTPAPTGVSKPRTF
jgi:hypothetical protein